VTKANLNQSDAKNGLCNTMMRLGLLEEPMQRPQIIPAIKSVRGLTLTMSKMRLFKEYPMSPSTTGYIGLKEAKDYTERAWYLYWIYANYEQWDKR